MNQIIAKKSQYIHWTASEVYLAVKKRDWHQQSTPAHESGCDVWKAHTMHSVGHTAYYCLL